MIKSGFEEITLILPNLKLFNLAHSFFHAVGCKELLLVAANSYGEPPLLLTKMMPLAVAAVGCVLCTVFLHEQVRNILQKYYLGNFKTLLVHIGNISSQNGPDDQNNVRVTNSLLCLKF